MNATQLIEAITVLDPKLADAFSAHHTALVGKLATANQKLAEKTEALTLTQQVLVDACEKRDLYRSELVKLQQARGQANRRKARRIARQMIARGEV